MIEAYLVDDWKMLGLVDGAGQVNGKADVVFKKNSARIKSMDLITSFNTKIKVENQQQGRPNKCEQVGRRDI